APGHGRRKDVQLSRAGPARNVRSPRWDRLGYMAIVVCIVQGAGGLSSHVADPAIADLSWMAGCWRQEASGRIVDEVWMAPAGDAIFGMSRTVTKDRAVAHEFMEFRDGAHG